MSNLVKNSQTLSNMVKNGQRGFKIYIIHIYIHTYTQYTQLYRPVCDWNHPQIVPSSKCRLFWKDRWDSLQLLMNNNSCRGHPSHPAIDWQGRCDLLQCVNNPWSLITYSPCSMKLDKQYCFGTFCDTKILFAWFVIIIWL